MSKKEITKTKWELKDRIYILKGKSPLSYKISVRGLWFDEEQGINREVRFASNQKSLFVDEQDGHVKVEHIVFRDGSLHVPREQPLLQQLLSIYHPMRDRWEELDTTKEAIEEVDVIENQLDAMIMAKELDIEKLEAVMRTELGSLVSSMPTKELRRDAYVFAKNNPTLFLELVNDDEIDLRNLANLAVENSVISLADGNTTFKWKANGRKIMTIPFDQEPYAALAQYFKTDEGTAVLKSIKTKLK